MAHCSLRFASMDVNMDGTIQYEEFLDSWASWNATDVFFALARVASTRHADTSQRIHTHIPAYMYCKYNTVWYIMNMYAQSFVQV